MQYSPLEQFEIIPLIPIRINSFDVSFTNGTLIIIIVVLITYLITKIIITKSKGIFIPNRWQALMEVVYKFIYGILKENAGKKGDFFFPFMFAIFMFLLICNLSGIIPYSFTVTAHIVVTFTISLIIWIGSLVIGFRTHGLKYFTIFVPAGVPFVIIPIIIPIEIISFIIPLISLGVRLFANIISGHILLKVIVGFAWSIIIAGGFIFIAHFIPIIVLFILLFLETAVALIQAYIFTILSCLYIGNAIQGGH